MLMFSSVHLRSSSSTNLVKDNEQKTKSSQIHQDFTLLPPPPPLPLPLVGNAILKDFSYLLGAKFTEKNFVDVTTIDKW